HAVGPTITALRTRYLGVARAEAEKLAANWPGADERTRRSLANLAESIAAKLLHAPQVALKKGAAGEDGEGLLAAAHALFDLPPIEAVEEDVDDPGEAGE